VTPALNTAPPPTWVPALHQVEHHRDTHVGIADWAGVVGDATAVAADTGVDPTDGMTSEERIHWQILHRKKDGIQALIDDAMTRREPVAVLNEILLPPTAAVAHLPAVTVDAAERSRLLHGIAVPAQPSSSVTPGASVRVLDETGALLAIGLGALLGPLLLGRMVRNYRGTTALFLPYVIRGIGDIMLGLFTVPLLGQMLLFIYGVNTSAGMVTYQSAMQSEVPDRVRGRVFSLMDVGWNTGRIVSVGLAGILADRFGVVVVYYLGGTLLIGAGLLGFTTGRVGGHHKQTQ